jgi:hypothetical protein
MEEQDIDLNASWAATCEDYFKATGRRLDGQKPQPDEVVQMIKSQHSKDEKSDAKLKKIAKYVENTIVCLQGIGGVLSQAASMVFLQKDLLLITDTV